MMKIQHIANIFLAALLFCSCTEKEIEPGRIEPDNNKVRYSFNIDLGQGPCTKALTDNAQIRNMYVAVFDKAGYKLSEYAKAELASPAYAAGTNGVNYQYSIELTVSSSPRILHFIANAPESLSYGSESEVIGSLCTSLDNDDVNEFQEAYWQRIELDSIPAKPVEPLEDAYADTDSYNAAVAKYNSGMLAYNAAAARLNNIKLIRNYSKITLEINEGLADFKILGMWLINYPDRGTVAPYNRNTGEFMGDYLGYGEVDSLENNLYGNYQGFMLATTQLLSPKTAADFVESGENCKMITSASDAKCTTVGYVYEREKALFDPMYVIMKAEYGTSHEVCYYKVALQDKMGEFYSMLRNFNYLVKIIGVENKGEDTALAALLGAPTGDLSLNVEFKDITSISDGQARLSVSQTSMMLVGNIGETITVDDLWYKYEPLAGSVENDEYSDTEKKGVEITYDEMGTSGAVINTFSVKGSDDDGGHRYVTLKTVPIEAVHKTQTVTLQGKYLDSENNLRVITRKLELFLREYLTMDLSTGPNTDSGNIGHVSKNQGESSTVSIGIESDLPASMFPLDFEIEAARRTLTPDGDPMPVMNGTSTILDAAAVDASGAKCKDHPSFWFVKTVSWEDYQAKAPAADGKKYFVAKFKNNVTDEVTEHIYVSQKYFKQGKVDLVKYTAQSLSGVSVSPATIAVGGTTTYSFSLQAGHIPASGKVTVGLARLEEANTGGGYTRQLTYLRTETINEGGTDVVYDIYEMPVTKTANSLKLVAYESGKGYIKLWADEYNTDTRTVTIN